MKLFIICGHGGTDPGACAGGYSEADLVRRLARKMKERCPDVEIGDMNRNWYAEQLIPRNAEKLKKCQVLELHMDSATASAKGAHVIISDRFSPDKYDTALAENITKIFPGRAQKIVKRGNLQNVNQTAVRGISYRLLECGFISNQQDRGKFLSSMDEIAESILQAFNLKPASTSGKKGLYKVQVGAYSDKKNAEKMLSDLEKKGFRGYIKYE